MANPTLLQNYSAAVKADMRNKIIQQKTQKAVTLATFKSGSGARNESGAMVGLEIPYKRGVTFGETALNPLRRVTSFEPMVSPKTAKMFVGLTYSGFTVESEWFHEKDAARNKLPEGESDFQRDVVLTYYQHQNWYSIGPGTGIIGYFTTSGGSGLHSFAFDNTARGRSKGSLRVAVSPGTSSEERVLYQAVDEATNTVTATFYVVSKPSSVTAQVIVLSGAITAGNGVVRYGHYNRVMYGLGYHINHVPRTSYQGADTTVDDFLNSIGIDCDGGPMTATLLDSGKLAMEVEANDSTAHKNKMFHMTHGHHRSLAAYGYDLRTYNAEKGDAMKSFGVPRYYEDEDSIWARDEDMEDAYLYGRHRSDYWEYRQAAIDEVTNGKEQYPGVNLVGSTEHYRNWGEAKNIAWDARGEKGDNTGNGKPNSSIVFYNLEIPATNQVARGRSLV